MSKINVSRSYAFYWKIFEIIFPLQCSTQCKYRIYFTLYFSIYIPSNLDMNFKLLISVISFIRDCVANRQIVLLTFSAVLMLFLSSSSLQTRRLANSCGLLACTSTWSKYIAQMFCLLMCHQIRTWFVIWISNHAHQLSLTPNQIRKTELKTWIPNLGFAICSADYKLLLLG